MLTITQHDLKICIKRGLGFTQICEKYQCSLDELKFAINTIYESRNAAKITKDIQQNTKRLEKVSKKATKDRGMRALEESHPTPLEECTENSSISQLEQLKNQEATLSDTLIQLESEHKALIGKHRSNLKQLQQFYQRMQTIKQQFQAVNSEYEALVVSNNQLVDQINAVTECESKQSAALQDVRDQIQSLEIIPVCVYLDGRIELLEDSDIILDDSGNEELYQKFIGQELPKYQDLRLRDLRTISRVQAIIGNSARKLEFIFEDNTLESYCYA